MPTRVLLSIKPEFARAIMDGTKRYEFRRAIFRDTSISRVVLYASSPIQEVVGEFTVGRVLSAEPNTLWKRTRHGAGISKEFFDRYFINKPIAYAIEVLRPKRYRFPLQLAKDFNVASAPQSFCYL